MNDESDFWFEIFNPATRYASSAINRWTNGEIELELDDAREIPLEEVMETLQLVDAPANLVLLDSVGDLRGQLILIFDEINASQLVAMLLHRRPTAPEQWSELEASALRETGNILASAYLNGIAELIGRPILPSPPRVERDFPMIAIEQAVLYQAVTEDRVVLARTRFMRRGEQVDWCMVFVPAPELLHCLRHARETNVTK